MNIPQQLQQEYLKTLTRRHFFRDCGVGIGSIALASLLNESAKGEEKSAPAEASRLAAEAHAAGPLAVKPPHFPGKAKRVVYIHLAGAPSQLELFDYKPKLIELNGQPCPESLYKKERFAFIKGVPNMLGTMYKFKRHGESGVELSELLPHLAEVADDITVVRSMFTEQFNHAPAQMFLHTGSPFFGRPSMGSWITYGLGSESRDLPGFVVLVSGNKTPDGGASLWGSGFLPTAYQGVQCRSQGDPVLYVSNPPGMDANGRRQSLDAIAALNQMQLAEVGDPEIATRIAQYELAYRMQTAAPEVMDIRREPQHILELYGAKPGQVAFANNCLLARRLLENGVRFVQLYDWGWDGHGTNAGDDLVTQLPKKCRESDRPVAALLKDLKQRGMLDDTLIIWGGEFGRTPMNEERDGSKFLGRDHHPHCFTMWLAGGGMKGGFEYGQTDELGYHVAENKVHVHDLQATILHCLGFDHEKLTYKFQGRNFRLTDVFGNVVKDVLA